MARTASVLLIALTVFATLWLLPDPAPAQGSGEKTTQADCRSCHQDQHAKWQQTAHARAAMALKEEDRKNPACVSCHAPAGDPALGVACTTCHGSGFTCGDWHKATTAGRKLSSERDCRMCHRPTETHPDLEFDFVVDYEEVSHEKEPTGDDLFASKGIYRRFVTYGPKDGLPHHIVFAVKVNGDDVWVGTEDGFALLRDGKFKSWREEDGLVHQAVSSLDMDPATGELFIGTLGGVSIFDTKTEKFDTITEETVGLINNCVFGVTLYGDDLWVATFDGISRFNRKTRKCTNYHLHEAPLEEVWTYGTEAAPDRVNFAVWGGGLVEYFPERDHWQAYHDPDGSFELDLIRNDGVISQMTTSVSYDNGYVWVASYFGSAVYDSRDWWEFNEDDSGLASNFINFVKARRYEGWHATDKGVSVCDLKRKRWVNYRRLEGIDARTQVEITDLDGKRRRKFLLETPLAYNFVWAFDFQGEDVWIGTSDGLCRASYGTPEDKLFRIDEPLKLEEAEKEEAEEPVVGQMAKAGGEPIGLLPPGSLGAGFAQEVLGPEYTQPYVFFKKPHAAPLAKPFSDFVDPIGLRDKTFEDDPEVRIGFIGCLSGPAKAYSGEMLNGAQMAVDEINAAGGYQGKPAVLKIRDDQAHMGKNANQTVKLIFTDKVLAILGSMSSDTTHVALRVCLKAEVPELTSISTDPTITQIVVPWIFRCLADDWSQSRALAKLIFRDRGFTRVALLERNNRYGRMGSAEIKRVAKRMGHPITLAVRYGKTTKTFAEHIKKIKDYGADAVVIWGLYAKGSQIVREMHEAGLDIPIFGADGLVAQAFLDSAGEAAEGVVVTYPYDFYRDDPLTQSFNKRFRERYGHDPDSFAAHGYDAMYIVWRAVERAGLNRARIRNEMEGMKDFHGVTGMISFDHRNNDMRGVDFAVVHDGKFLPLRMAGEHVRKGRHEK